MKYLAGPLNGHIQFLHWGVIQISLANILLIAIMVMVFVLALILPFPHGTDRTSEEGGTDESH